MLNPQTSSDSLLYNELFGLFPAHIRSQLFNKSKTHVYKPGDVIFTRGEEGPWMAAILAGRVRLCVHSAEGKEMLLSMVERGEIFGERAVLDGFPRAADAIAEDESTCMIITRDELLPLLFQYPESMFSVIKMLCNRMRRYTKTMETYALWDLPMRLAGFLLFLSRKYGQDENGSRVIHAGLSQTDLAHYLASSRESVNRQLKAFASQGLIALHGDDITLLDGGALEKIRDSVGGD